ncbi:hypothetical protein QF000_001976 [Paraburkholderia atlantica]|nr:hypothetical protein [Paraburkholderia atlantica]
MAQIFPAGWSDTIVRGAAKREIESLGVRMKSCSLSTCSWMNR